MKPVSSGLGRVCLMLEAEAKVVEGEEGGRAAVAAGPEGEEGAGFEMERKLVLGRLEVRCRKVGKREREGEREGEAGEGDR